MTVFYLFMKNQNYTNTNNNIHFNILDSLRGLSAIGVVFFWHYQHFIFPNARIITNYPFSSIFPWFYAYGWILVDLFFVLSGFVLCHTYKEKIKNNLINFKQYILNRLSRLYPLTILTTLIVLIIQKIRVEHGLEYFIYPFNDSFHFVTNFLLLQGIVSKDWSFNGPSWTVSIEMLLYILFFFSTKFIYKNRYVFYIGMILLGFFLQIFPDVFVRFSFISRGLIGFFVGCFAYEIYNYTINVNTKKILLTNILKIFCLIITIFTIVQTFFIPTTSYVMTTLFVTGFFPAIILLSLNSKIIHLIFDRKIFHCLGTLSFSIYMIHFPLQLLIVTINSIYNLHINFESYYFFLSFFAITVLASYFVYNFYEQKIQSRLRLYFNK